MGIGLISAQKPRNKHSLHLSGVLRIILSYRSDPLHPQALALKVVEQCLINPLRLLAYKFENSVEILMDLEDDINNPVYKPFLNE